MSVILILSIITLAHCLESKNGNIDDELKKVISKYVNKIPDMKPQFVIDQGLSELISRYFKEKITTFPLFRISLKLDRNPVKIPWTLTNLTEPVVTVNDKTPKKVRTYKFVPNDKDQ